MAPGGMFNECAISEMELVICRLEKGTRVKLFSHRKKPEIKFLRIRRETRQLVCLRAQDARTFDFSGICCS